MAETKLIDRLMDRLGFERKGDERPAFPRASSFGPDPFRFTGWGWNKNRWGTAIDYANEVGPLENSSLIAAILNWTATQLPEADPVLYRRNEKGEEEADPNHAAVKLIERPNPFHTWSNYAGGLSFSWWISGNVYFKKVRNPTGQVQELWYLPDFMVEPRWPDDGKTPDVPTTGPNKAKNGFLSHYQYTIPGKDPQLINASDMVHVKRFVNLANPREGMGAFDAVVKEIYGDEKAAHFAATILKNMGIVVPLLSPKDPAVTINETQAGHIKEKWIQGTTGDNTGAPFVNSIALEATKFAFSPQELDLKELRKVPESRVAAVTGIPAIVLQYLVGLEHGHYGAAYQQAREQGYESVIIPLQNDIAEQLSHQLLYEFDGEAAQNEEIRFDTSHVRVLQEDRDAVYRRASEALRSGGTTVNQFLASIGKPDIGKNGDVRFVPGMSTPMSNERMLAIATGESEPDPLDADTLDLAKFAEMERRMFATMEEQMREFKP